MSESSGRLSRRSCRLLPGGAARLAQEDVVEARLVERDRARGEARRVKRPQQLRNRDLAAVDIEADETRLRVVRGLADEWECLDDREDPGAGPVHADRH